MQSVVSEVVFSINAKDRVHQQHSIVPTGAATLCVEQCIERNFSEAVFRPTPYQKRLNV